jgi:hypothetical protein
MGARKWLRSNNSGLVYRGSDTVRLPTFIVGISVGFAVEIGGVVAVAVSVLMGRGVALGTGVGVDAGAQAEKMSIADKAKANVRFIVHTPLRWLLVRGVYAR